MTAPESASLETPPVPGPAPKSRMRASRGVFLVALDNMGGVDLCVLSPQGGEAAEPHFARVTLDGGASAAKLRQAFRELPLKPQSGSPIHILIPSEDLFLRVEEFPSVDPQELQTMAEGVMQGLVELDAKDHSMAHRVLSRGEAKSVCLLAIFHRERIERVFEILQRLGITHPLFVVDLLADWTASSAAIQEGCWGWASVVPGGNKVVLKALKISTGVIRDVRQRFYDRPEIDAAWLVERESELFPEDFAGQDRSEPSKFSWHVAEKAADMKSRLGAYVRLIAEGRLTGLELQPVFWREHLKKHRIRRILIRAGAALAVLYAAFLITLGGAAWWMAHEHRQQSLRQAGQETGFKAAMEVKRELAAVRAGMDPSGSALEVLRQVVEPMPEGLVLESFSFRAREDVKLRGIGTASEGVYDFVGRLRTNPLFRGAKVESVGAAPERGGVTWQVAIPLQTASAP